MSADTVLRLQLQPNTLFALCWCRTADPTPPCTNRFAWQPYLAALRAPFHLTLLLYEFLQHTAAAVNESGGKYQQGYQSIGKLHCEVGNALEPLLSEVAHFRVSTTWGWGSDPITSTQLHNPTFNVLSGSRGMGAVHCMLPPCARRYLGVCVLTMLRYFVSGA
jgi:hypothetical protein